MFHFTFHELVSQWKKIQHGTETLMCSDNDKLVEAIAKDTTSYSSSITEYLTELFIYRNDPTLPENKRGYSSSETMDILTVCSLGYNHCVYREYVCSKVLETLDKFDIFFYTKAAWASLVYRLLQNKRISPIQTACMFQTLYAELTNNDLHPIDHPELGYLFLFMSYFHTKEKDIRIKQIDDHIGCIRTVSSGKSRTTVHTKQLFGHLAKLDMTNISDTDILNKYATIGHMLLWNTIEQHKFFVYVPRLFSIAVEIFSNNIVQNQPIMHTRNFIESLLTSIEEYMFVSKCYIGKEKRRI